VRVQQVNNSYSVFRLHLQRVHDLFLSFDFGEVGRDVQPPVGAALTRSDQASGSCHCGRSVATLRGGDVSLVPLRVRQRPP
jgi:hypothetical protein